MLESEYIVRNSKRSIDVKASIHAFAMAIGRQVQAEEPIRNDKVIRKAIRECFRKHSVKVFNLPTLILLVLKDLPGVTSETYNEQHKRVAKHIKLNNGAYLHVQRGKHGGVSLKKAS